MDTTSLIEAILFYRASPTKISEIGKMLGKKKEETEAALAALAEKLADRGLRLLQTGDTVALATAPEAARHIEELRAEELSGELGRATMETLTLILYRAPVLRSEIDYIRGVNSSFSIRTLLVRGLIDRKRNEKGLRGFVYAPTIETLAYLGITRTDELPDYAAVRTEVEKFRREFAVEAESAYSGTSAEGEEADSENETYHA